MIGRRRFVKAALLSVALLLCFIAAWWVVGGRPSPSRDKYELIKEGMSKDDLIALLGPPLTKEEMNALDLAMIEYEKKGLKPGLEELASERFRPMHFFAETFFWSDEREYIIVHVDQENRSISKTYGRFNNWSLLRRIRFLLGF